MSNAIVDIVEADEAARREVESAARRAAARVDAERARRRELEVAAQQRERQAHEALLQSIVTEAERQARARGDAREATRAARLTAAAAAKPAAVAAFLAIVRGLSDGSRP